MKPLHTRWAALLAAAPLLIVAGCGSSADEGGDSPGAQEASADDLVVAAGGGDYRDFQEDFNVPAMTDQCSSSIVWDYTEDDVKITTVRTQGEAAGTLDVVELPDTRMQQLVNDGLMLPLTEDEVPNISIIREGLTSEYWIPHIYSASVIIYNEDKVPDASSYNILWDDQYSGKIGVLSTQWSNFFYAATAVSPDASNSSDWGAGWEKLKELSDDVVVFASQEEMGQALMSGQIWLTVNWKARALQWNDMGAVPLGASVPEEGTFPVVFAAGVPANAPNPECAFDYLNGLLDPEGQTQFAENMGYAPTVTETTLGDERAEAVDFTPDEQSRIQPLDISYIAENDADWGDLWQQEFIN
ncbi:ABC transporter substrate-binding protein [Ornithinimicrobium cryptoxanthini]|uniref:Extracellular solute-binding protein n=1 Tax=Ornithinimicrobium cryptoxanthini TaxID=2934161 RepID=A0ABY4YM17_9MICO|nr:extracellular solute-binding protein [Ornithinimicrobium cryptoxanthini]USQ77830.1 extracellular solute-binding protein [Ornithinimicrobium cryptoxanthini]